MNSVVKVEPEEETEEGDGERDLLLGSKPKPALVNGGGGGGLAKKRHHQKGSRRRVQWNDRNGNKLVEVLEFQPRFRYLFVRGGACLDMLRHEVPWRFETCGCVGIFTYT